MISADKPRQEPWSLRGYVFGQLSCEGQRQKFPGGFPEQREPRFVHLRGPGIQLTGECKESCSCEEILKFWRWGWQAAARGTLSCNSGERDSITLRHHAFCVLPKKFSVKVAWNRSRRKTIAVKLSCL